MFNQALLARQGWRLIQTPDSLCARVLKGKYYPHTDFLNATVPAKASATWKAIVAGREALQVGLIRRVGDGSTISIWNDNWIPNTPTLKPGGRIGSMPLNRVSELIDDYSGNWNEQIVRQNFLHPDAEAILNIPLNPAGGEDTLAWSLEKSGIYTVKSAYRSLVTRNELGSREEGATTETSSANKQLWTALWRLRVVPKVRVFWWRVLRGILPDSTTLRYRHIKQLGLCDVCKAMDEDMLHALIHCSHAKAFWKAARDRFQLYLPRLHPDTWARDILIDPCFWMRTDARLSLSFIASGRHGTTGLMIAKGTTLYKR